MRGEEERLLALARRLAPADRAALIAFAEFLATRAPMAAVAPAPRAIPEPQHEPRPEGETVVRAIQRLTRTYSMLDRRKLLVETSRCVESHVIHGRAADDVIEELEIVFATHYENVKREGVKE